jgi:hypothetical protein
VSFGKITLMAQSLYRHTPRGSTSSAAMMGLRAMFASAVGLVLLAGCGKSASTSPAPSAPPPPPIAARPDVIVTLDGERHTCVVALYSEAQGSAIPCDEVVSFVRDELRVPSGSIYDIRAIPTVDKAEMARVEASLQGGGYRFIGGPHEPPANPPIH